MPRCRLHVLVADPAPLVRGGVQFLLAGADDIEVVAEAAAGDAAIRAAVELRPDIVILDPRLPARSGLEVIAELRRRVPDTKILVLAARRSESEFRAAMAAGAAGYLLKDDDLSRLPAILRELAAHGFHLSSGVSAIVVRDYRNHGRSPRGSRLLTDRQAEILALIAEGCGSREIGARLGITLRTVHTHRARIMRRLHVHTEGALVHTALRHGLLDVR